MKKNQYIIVRTASAGVFAGYFVSKQDTEVTLKNARRLWFWSGAASLSELAMKGVKNPLQCKFPAPVTKVALLGVIEILDVTDEAKKIIEAVPVWSAH